MDYRENSRQAEREIIIMDSMTGNASRMRPLEEWREFCDLRRDAHSDAQSHSYKEVKQKQWLKNGYSDSPSNPFNLKDCRD